MFGIVKRYKTTLETSEVTMAEVNNGLGLQSDITSIDTPNIQIGTPQGKSGTKSGFALNETVDTGTGVANPTDVGVTSTLRPLNDANMFQSFVAGLAPTGRDWTNATLEHLQFDPDINYDSTQDYKDFADHFGVLNDNEVKYLQSAESSQAFDYRKDYLLARRQREETANANPISGAIGSALDADIATAFIPVGGTEAYLGRVGARVAGAIAGAGTAYGVNTALGSANVRNSSEQALDMFSFGLSGAFALHAPKSVKPVEDAVESATGASRGTPDSVSSANPNTPPRTPNGGSALQQAISEELNKVNGTSNSIDLGDGDVLKTTPPKITDSPIQLPKKSVEYGWLSRAQSVADELTHYIGDKPDDPMQKAVASFWTNGDNVPSHTIAVQRDLETRLTTFENALNKATTELHGSSDLMRKQYTLDQQSVAQRVYTNMQKVDQEVLARLDNNIPTEKADIHNIIDNLDDEAPIKNAMKSYIDSDFATSAYDHVKRVGMLDDETLDNIVRRSTYMPIKHSYDAIHDLINGGGYTQIMTRRGAIADFIGNQILRMYPSLAEGDFRLSANQIGEHFIQTQKTNALQFSGVRAAPLTKEELRTLLETNKVPSENISNIVDQMFKQPSNTGVKNLRRRIQWDFNAVGQFNDGTTFTMGDLVTQDAMNAINSYSRSLSSRIGLAQYGWKTEAQWDSALAEVLENLPKGADRDKAKGFLQNLRDAALGRPIGEKVPDAFRSLNSLAGLWTLANSGMYAIVDLNTQLAQIGLKRSIPAMVEALRPMIKGVRGLDKVQSKDLADILSLQLMSLDRWKTRPTHFDDGFDIKAGFTNAADYYGQSTRFLNGSEFVKRYQIGLMVNVYLRALRNASKGVAEDINFLKKKMDFSQELLDGVSKEYKTHGNNLDAWDGDIRIAMQQKLFHETDNMAHTLLHGEVPAILEYSAVGKTIFPYMRYVVGMQQHVLRRTYMRDGAAGVALVFAVQAPTAMAIAMAKNASKGEDPEKDLLQNTLGAMSATGSLAIPLDMILGGGSSQGGSTALVPLQRTIQLAGKIIDGEATVRDFKEKTPLNHIAGLNLVVPLFDEDNKK